MSSVSMTALHSPDFVEDRILDAEPEPKRGSLLDRIVTLPTGVGELERGSLEEEILQELGALPPSWR